MRYLPLTDADRREMLGVIGAKSVDELFRDVPASARLGAKIAGLPDHLGELEVERAFLGYAAKNLSPATTPFFIGAGAYRHHVPATVDYMIQRGEFLTSYTPYQPEITQGTLQYLFEFQTQITMLTGMEVANASMYDGSTGASEAVLMANRVTRRHKALVSGGLHPHYRAIIETAAKWEGFSAVVRTADVEGLEDLIAAVDKETSCVVVQNPSFFGHVRDFAKLAEVCHAAGALLIVVVTEVVSLGLIKPPGEMGADIALNRELMNAYPFSRLTDVANVLVMPALHSAAISTKMLQELGGATVLGPLIVGLDKPVQIVQLGATDVEIVNMAAIAAFGVGA